MNYPVGDTLDQMRHSCAHVMAAAIARLFPGAKFGVGPVTEDGFYYDVQTDEPIKEADLARIEKEMKRFKARKIDISREERDIDDAITLMEARGQPFKIELLHLLKEKGSTAIAKEIGDERAVESSPNGVEVVSLYSIADFADLCRGPHVRTTKDVGHFKLVRVSGAYWRGDETRPQLQRIYGICFPTEEEVEHRIWQLEERKRRDHRRIGKDLGLFALHEEVGPGLPFWLPKGRVIRDELEFLAREMEAKQGYQPVITPEIAKRALFEKSGHLPYYAEDMYAPIKIDEEEYYLRPMNCPFHHLVYRSEARSYRDLPLRISEYGTVYRYEYSGAMSGLMRTRSFCQNDAHLYCRKDQAQAELTGVLHLHAYYYNLLQVDGFYARLSLPDVNNLAKYVDNPTEWMKAVEILRASLVESGYEFVEVEGEAAFYGPKVDFMIRSATGIEYAMATSQLDFHAAGTFDLHYVDEHGAKEPVYVIHRAPLGSHERFVAFLIEHYAGAFPTWLAPVQVRVIPITDRHTDYADAVVKKIRSSRVSNGSHGIRVEVDNSSERMQKKIRNAQLEKVGYMLIVGDQEAETGAVAVRRRSGDDLGGMPLERFLAHLTREIEDRQDLAFDASG